MPLTIAYPEGHCSPWFPATIKPSHPGWYECRGPRINGFLYLLFKRGEWHYFGKVRSDPQYPRLGDFVGDEWRGVTKQFRDARARRQPFPSRQHIGATFGWLTCLSVEFATQRGAHSLFRCACGRTILLNTKWVADLNTTSCGCMSSVRNAFHNRPWATFNSKRT